MDNNPSNNGTERSAEEIAWDEEFKETKKEEDLGQVLADLVKLGAGIPAVLAQLPSAILPEETARHTRAALRESFLALRSLLGALGDNIEKALAEPGEADKGEPGPGAVQGPEGTWGNARQAGSARPSATSQRPTRIEISDEPEPDTKADTTRNGEEPDDLPDERGLRADINY